MKMASSKTRIRNIRRRANKNISKKDDTVTVDADDFFWLLTQIHLSNNLEILEMKIESLENELKKYKGI